MSSAVVAVLLAAGTIIGPVLAASNSAQAQEGEGPRGNRLQITVGDRRIAALMHGAPDVYLSGAIDDDAPARFRALVQSGKIPTGSNVFLNSPGGSLAAGLAIGRLFRKDSMVTYIGVPPFAANRGDTLKGPPAICASACAYAYLGGLYRMAPDKGSLFGVHQFYIRNQSSANVGDIERVSGAIVAYLHAMGINPDIFTVAAAAVPNQVVWFDGQQMLASGLANNGLSPIMAQYTLTGNVPFLRLAQIAYDGEHKIDFHCGPNGSLLVESLYLVGSARARQIVERATDAYFVFDGHRIPADGPGRVHALALRDAVIMMRQLPTDFLLALTTHPEIESWVDGRNGVFRFGFRMNVKPVIGKVGDYYNNCIMAYGQGK